MCSSDLLVHEGEKGGLCLDAALQGLLDILSLEVRSLWHNDNNKWYGVVLEVSADKLGLPKAGIVDVLNVKSDPLLIGSLRGQDGYFPAYHMNKEKWLSIQLGKPELDDAIKDLLSLSHELTAPKKRNPKSSAKNPGDSANGKEKN